MNARLKFRTRSTPPKRPIFSLDDSQLSRVVCAARLLSPDKRDALLQRVGAMLRLRHRFNDNDVIEVTRLALFGLVHHDTAA